MARPRPRISKCASRGLRLLVENYRIRVANGFLPHHWSARDRQDADTAMAYMDRLSRWHMKMPKAIEELEVERAAERANQPIIPDE